MRGRAWRVVAVSLVLFIVVEMASCRMYDAYVAPGTPEGLLRGEIAGPTALTLSYLAAPVAQPELPRIIYIHGTPGDATAFRRYLHEPEPGLEPLSVDRPGFGFSRDSGRGFTLSEQASALAPLLVKRAGRGTILVGHSLGGPVAVQAALDFPEVVGGLVILAGSLDPAQERVGWYQHLVEFAMFPYMIPADLRKANREVIPLRSELETLRQRLKELRCPVAIVHAPDDMLVPVENVDYMLREFPAGSVVSVIRPEGKNHFIPWNDEADVRRAIRRVAAAMTKENP